MCGGVTGDPSPRDHPPLLLSPALAHVRGPAEIETYYICMYMSFIGHLFYYSTAHWTFILSYKVYTTSQHPVENKKGKKTRD